MRVIDIKELADTVRGLLNEEDYQVEPYSDSVSVSAKAPEEMQKRTNTDKGPLYDPIVNIVYNSLYNGLIITETDRKWDCEYEAETKFKKEQRQAMQVMAEKLESIVQLPEGVTYVTNLVITMNDEND